MKGADLLKQMKEMGIKSYLLDQMFKTKKILHYSKRVPIGVDDYGDKVTLSFGHTQRIMVLGASGSGKTFLVRSIMNRANLAGLCLDKETKILNNLSLKSFRNGDIVPTFSYDFKRKKLVSSKSVVINNRRKQELYKIILDNGEFVNASLEHKFFRVRDNKIEEVSVKDLKVGDEILTIEKNLERKMPKKNRWFCWA